VGRQGPGGSTGLPSTKVHADLVAAMQRMFAAINAVRDQMIKGCISNIPASPGDGLRSRTVSTDVKAAGG
jgi:hypothetical protein